MSKQLIDVAAGASLSILAGVTTLVNVINNFKYPTQEAESIVGFSGAFALTAAAFSILRYFSGKGEYIYGNMEQNLRNRRLWAHQVSQMKLRNERYVFD